MPADLAHATRAGRDARPTIRSTRDRHLAIALLALLGCHKDADLSCADLERGQKVPFVLTGTTVGAGADSTASCGGGGEDVTVAFRAPEAGDYAFDTHLSGVDTVLYALAECGGEERACDDESGLGDAAHLVLTLEKDEGVLLVVDTPAGGGPYVLTGTAVGARESACGDGFDDDGDQAVDCADDDCAAQASCAGECPAGSVDAPPSAATGDTTGAPDQGTPSCTSGSSSDWALSFQAPADGRYGFALSAADTRFDSVLVLRDGCGGAELACADVGGNGGEAVAVDLLAGDEIVAVVDGFGGDYGPFSLVTFTPSLEEADCGDGIDEDVDGFPDCEDPDCAGDGACVEDCGNGVDDDADRLADCGDEDCQHDSACAEDCTNGADDDGDGPVDCADPGCDFDPVCPEDCVNREDDDGDGFVDCLDGACAVLPECGGECPDQVLAAPGAFSGTTAASHDLEAPSCGGPGAPEVFVEFTPSETGTWVFDTEGSSYDTVLSVLSDCGGAEVACSDDGPGWLGPSQIALAIAAGDTVVAVVDGLTGASGDFVLNVALAPVEELDCADGLDDDFDGLPDCEDPGCAGVDGCGECPDSTLSGGLPIVRNGTTSGASQFSGSCGYGTAPDHSYAFTAASTRTYTFSTAGSAFDTVLYVLETCGGPELTCNDDAGGSTSAIDLPMTAGDEVIIIVDGYEGESGAYKLTVD